MDNYNFNLPSDINIVVIGLGYVGLPLAVEFGKKFNVIGYDINLTRIKELQSGLDSTLEVSNTELYNSKGLSFSNDANDIGKANIFIITVPTPVDRANRPNLSPLKLASSTVGKFLKPASIVIYESTVYPGAT
jgi:UDP-N-acetyl-D-galactosamine dehydrogenase